MHPFLKIERVAEQERNKREKFFFSRERERERARERERDGFTQGKEDEKAFKFKPFSKPNLR